MKRKALLIGAPGSEERFLAGVSVDMNNIENFLLSKNGGEWFSDEITKVVNPTRTELGSKLDQLKNADYSIIYFSGHGGISTVNSKYYVEINSDGDDFDVMLFNELSGRELIIIDSCRSYFTPMLNARRDSFLFAEMKTSSRYRERYDAVLQKSEYGTVYFYAASPGQAANEDSNGGYFTQGLLRSTSSDYADCLYINESFSLAKEFVASKTRYQTPQKDGSIRRNNWFPFALK